MLYVQVLKSLDDTSFGKAQLEALLKCQVVHYTCVKALPCPVFRVKIFEEALQEAIIAGQESGCFVDLWRRPKETVASHGSGICASEGISTHPRTECHRPALNVTCWNCRGLSNSHPSLEALMERGSKVLVLSEHWLWPFELEHIIFYCPILFLLMN